MNVSQEEIDNAIEQIKIDLAEHVSNVIGHRCRVVAYKTGNLMRSIENKIDDDGNIVIGSDVNYSIYVEPKRHVFFDDATIEKALDSFFEQ